MSRDNEGVGHGERSYAAAIGEIRPEETRDYLIRMLGPCIGCGSPTASGQHMMRALGRRATSPL